MSWSAASNAGVAWLRAARPTCARISWELWPSIASPGSSRTPRDQRAMKEYFEVVGTEEGIFGCLGLLGCEDICPKHLPLQDQLGMLRRKMGWTAVRHLFDGLLGKTA